MESKGCEVAVRGRRGVRLLSSFVVAVVLVLVACEVPTGLPRVESRFRFPVESVEFPVLGVPAEARTRQLISRVDLAHRVKSAVMRITPDNGVGARGHLNLAISGGGVTVGGTVDVTRGDQFVTLTETQVRALLGSEVTVSASGTLCAADGCSRLPAPYPVVRLENELELVVELGGREVLDR